MTLPLDHVSPVWTRARQFVAARGDGSYLYDMEGHAYLDFTSGIGVTNTGHCHPHVVEAIRHQAGQLLHGQANIVFHRPMLELISLLQMLVPGQLDSFFFSNSGAEIVEAGVKLAKQATGRTNVIVFEGSFHGRTHLTMTMTTSKTIYRVGYQPLVAGIFVAPFPYAFALGMDDERAVSHCLASLKRLLKTQSAPEETACIVIEPVLGEGGYVPAPTSFLQELRDICNHYGILLVCDEVQTGFGRTGRWFALERAGITPDILLMAKGIASGLPLSAMAASSSLMERWTPGSHGGTYGGNAVACAAAVATIEVIRDEGLLPNAERQGLMLQEGLRQIQKHVGYIGDVRGHGLMIACEFSNRDGGPDTELTRAVVQRAFEKERMMLLTCGAYDNVIRWIPPLNVSDEQVEDGLERFHRALTDVVANKT